MPDVELTLSKEYAQPSAAKLKVIEVKLRITGQKFASDGTPVGPPCTFEKDVMADQARFDEALAAARAEAPAWFPT